VLVHGAQVAAHTGRPPSGPNFEAAKASVDGAGNSFPASGMSEPKNRIRTKPFGDVERMPLVGRSPAIQEVYRALARLMPTDLTVMITGESGTGKEFVARALHDYGKRNKGPFVAINMAAISCDLIEGFEEAKGGKVRNLAIKSVRSRR
jgi:transcriptional regulator with AAA-type ATPase domain